jgi:hypothetical protein
MLTETPLRAPQRRFSFNSTRAREGEFTLRLWAVDGSGNYHRKIGPDRRKAGRRHGRKA